MNDETTESVGELVTLLDEAGLAESRGQASYELGDYRSATQLLATAAMRQADREELSLRVNRSVRKQVRRWHFRMMNDRARNQAYQAAIAAAVHPGDVVLDIGTGGGITAMMCARAGAAHVYSCEHDPFLAALGRKIIERNELDDRITVLARSSRDLAVGAGLPSPADVLVAEIFDCGLLGESALATLADAAERLLTPGGTLVPSGARIYGQLVESETLHELNHVDRVAGFDVSPFNVVESREYFASYLNWYPHRLLSEPFEIFDFSFGSQSVPAERRLRVPVIHSGRCHAIVMWFLLDLGPDLTLSSGPWDPLTHWRQAVQTLRIPVALSAGDTISLTARHDQERVRTCFEH